MHHSPYSLQVQQIIQADFTLTMLRPTAYQN